MKLMEIFKDVDKKKNVVVGAQHEPEKLDDVHHSVINYYTRNSPTMNYKLMHRNSGVKFRDRISMNDAEGMNELQDAILTQNKLPEGLHLFSGIKFDLFKMYEHHRVGIGAAIRIHSPAFTSTSSDFHTAFGFATSFKMSTLPEHFVSALNEEVLKQTDDDLDYFKTYNHILCFDTTDIKALKVTAENGGHYGSEEFEFILPHSIDIEISGIPTCKVFSSAELTFVWDVKIISTAQTRIEKDEHNPHSEINFDKIHDLLITLKRENPILNGNITIGRYIMNIGAKSTGTLDDTVDVIVLIANLLKKENSLSSENKRILKQIMDEFGLKHGHGIQVSKSLNSVVDDPYSLLKEIEHG